MIPRKVRWEGCVCPAGAAHIKIEHWGVRSLAFFGWSSGASLEPTAGRPVNAAGLSGPLGSGWLA